MWVKGLDAGLPVGKRLNAFDPFNASKNQLI
jgi:hypothetical protein